VSDKKLMNRWLVVLGAILIQLALGAIYAWSVFTPNLKEAPYKFTAEDTQWIFGIELAAFALVMIVAGRMQAKFPPRYVAALGGIVMGLGYVGASFVGTSFWGHLVCIGLVGGAGIGLGYVVPIACGVKWFPDKKGLVSGLSVAGFGFGALIWVQLAGGWGHLIERLGGANGGVANVFFYYGIAFAVLVLIGSIWMVNPPAGYKPEGWVPPQPAGGSAAGTLDLTSGEMLRTPQFYALWSMFLAGAMAGLMVIGCIKLFGIAALQDSGMAKAQASDAAGFAMGVFFAICNGLGRILWGMASDKLGRKVSLAAMFTLQGIVMLAFYQMGFRTETLYVGAAVIGFNFGGTLALFPAATADFFGNKTVGMNYGWMFTAYGLGGIVGPYLGGRFGKLADHSGKVSDWSTPFIIAGIACLVAAAAALVLKAPSRKHA
jgi:MFS transporter, OFA family, oxalate/formate antiporter